MASVTIQRIGDPSGRSLPLLQEIEKRLREVQQRAFEFFDRRGRAVGHELEDWIRAEHQVMGWTAAELAEKDNAYKLEMTLPGFDARQVDVTASPTEIVVHAEIKPEERVEKDHVLWTEFGPNDVYRRFPLPEPIDLEKTKATLDQGLLKITAAKAAAAAGKTIPVA